ncbi:MAG: hypothetical protein PVJ04_09735 [Gemmatimonadota bacterium]|jgi:hypothetical protein
MRRALQGMDGDRRRGWTRRWSPMILIASLAASTGTPLPLPWGAEGHHIVTRAAVSHLPAEMPAFFRSAGHQLEYLGPEPDRWRSRELKEMDDAWEFDHYIDLENVPQGALEASDRYEFIAALYAAGIHRPQQYVGFLPWRILEMYQRLLTEFAIWRNLEGDPQRPFVEARILNDAGILGHYAADATQPHHTTIHFNGWAEGAPNPRGFTTARDFHARFESAFVEAHVSFQDVDLLMASSPMAIEDPRRAVWSEVRTSNATVERMYELELEHGFDPEASPDPAVTDFVVQRLVAGAEMLRGLWWSAWTESEGLAARRRAQGWTP